MLIKIIGKKLNSSNGFCVMCVEPAFPIIAQVTDAPPHPDPFTVQSIERQNEKR